MGQADDNRGRTPIRRGDGALTRPVKIARAKPTGSTSEQSARFRCSTLLARSAIVQAGVAPELMSKIYLVVVASRRGGFTVV
jgi:hypothetical protein